MAYVVKDVRGRSPFWYAVYRDPSDQRRWLKKSTGLTSKSKALEMAHALQRASNEARRGMFTEARARDLVSEILQSVNGGEGLRMFTVRAWFEHFRKVKLDSQAQKTAVKYAQVEREFLESLRHKADLNILSVTSADVRAFRDHRKAKGLTATTLNDDLTLLSAIFNGAWRDHVITNNPCTALEPVKDIVTPKKRQKHAFTVEQIKALLAEASPDWRGLILTAFYSGARLDNCANLRWRNIDYQKGKITFERYSKHGDEHEVPLHEALAEHFLSLKTPKKDDAYLFPSLAQRRVTNLSKEFRKLMAKAHLANQKVREKGKGAARDVWALGFHSFRRTNISFLANADVSEERRMALTAHSTREVHKGYTTHEFEQLRKANAVLPRL
jgi:integrase